MTIKAHDIKLIPVHPSKYIVDILQINTNIPIIMVTTTSTLSTDEIFEYTEVFKKSSRTQISCFY